MEYFLDIGWDCYFHFESNFRGIKSAFMTLPIIPIKSRSVASIPAPGIAQTNMASRRYARGMFVPSSAVKKMTVKNEKKIAIPRQIK